MNHPFNQHKNTADKQMSYEQFLSAGISPSHINQQIYHDTPVDNRLININHLTYFLYICSYFTVGLLLIVPIVINYQKRHHATGTWLATHFDWQIKTFWYGLIYGMVGSGLILLSFVTGFISLLSQSFGGGITAGFLFIVGLLLLGFTILWHLYRIVKGWIALSNHKPVP